LRALWPESFTSYLGFLTSSFWGYVVADSEACHHIQSIGPCIRPLLHFRAPEHRLAPDSLLTPVPSPDSAPCPAHWRLFASHFLTFTFLLSLSKEHRTYPTQLCRPNYVFLQRCSYLTSRHVRHSGGATQILQSDSSKCNCELFYEGKKIMTYLMTRRRSFVWTCICHL